MLIADSIDKIEPADPIDKIEPADPIDKIEPADPIDKIEPADPIGPAMPVGPKTPVRPAVPVARGVTPAAPMSSFWQLWQASTTAGRRLTRVGQAPHLTGPARSGYLLWR